MTHVKSLLVIWQNKETQSYFHIGTLNFDGAHYFFTYTHHNDGHRTVRDAIRNGYYLHPSFPIIDKPYKSETLFPAFDRRIPSPQREDFKQIIADLGLNHDADRMDVLSATRGMLSGDTYSFEQPLRLKNKVLQSEFYINGMRHRDLPKNWNRIIQIGEKMQLIPEPTNPYDKRAVRIETTLGLHLGYVPGFYAEAINSLITNHANPTITIKDIRPKSSPQWWVNVEFSCDLTSADNKILQNVNLSGIIEAA